jgi:septum formation protein
MRHLDPAEIKAYLATGEWKGCVGSYRVEGQGLKLFERIEGDLTNARGLPALRLCSALRSLGVELFK